VFAPLYLVLRRRGVKFRFFHRVCRLELVTFLAHTERTYAAPLPKYPLLQSV
jgi:hypothetical protein